MQPRDSSRRMGVPDESQREEQPMWGDDIDSGDDDNLDELGQDTRTQLAPPLAVNTATINHSENATGHELSTAEWLRGLPVGQSALHGPASQERQPPRDEGYHSYREHQLNDRLSRALNFNTAEARSRSDNNYEYFVQQNRYRGQEEPKQFRHRSRGSSGRISCSARMPTASPEHGQEQVPSTSRSRPRHAPEHLSGRSPYHPSEQAHDCEGCNGFYGQSDNTPAHLAVSPIHAPTPTRYRKVVHGRSSYVPPPPRGQNRNDAYASFPGALHIVQPSPSSAARQSPSQGRNSVRSTRSLSIPRDTSFVHQPVMHQIPLLHPLSATPEDPQRPERLEQGLWRTCWQCFTDVVVYPFRRSTYLTNLSAYLTEEPSAYETSYVDNETTGPRRRTRSCKSWLLHLPPILLWLFTIALFAFALETRNQTLAFECYDLQSQLHLVRTEIGSEVKVWSELIRLANQTVHSNPEYGKTIDYTNPAIRALLDNDTSPNLRFPLLSAGVGWEKHTAKASDVVIPDVYKESQGVCVLRPLVKETLMFDAWWRLLIYGMTNIAAYQVIALLLVRPVELKWGKKVRLTRVVKMSYHWIAVPLAGATVLLICRARIAS